MCGWGSPDGCKELITNPLITNHSPLALSIEHVYGVGVDGQGDGLSESWGEVGVEDGDQPFGSGHCVDDRLVTDRLHPSYPPSLPHLCPPGFLPPLAHLL